MNNFSAEVLKLPELSILLEIANTVGTLRGLLREGSWEKCYDTVKKAQKFALPDILLTTRGELEHAEVSEREIYREQYVN
tara:strand:+ start:40 stop:279 length:240 start_codon:yes stop_codon:yes gene_type:complete